MTLYKRLLRVALLPLIILNINSATAQNALNNDMTLSEITALEKQISKTLGTYPELFTPYKDQTVGKVKLEKVELDID